MNKIVKMTMFLVALSAMFSFAQQFGIRAGFNLYDFSSDYSQIDKDLKIGYGYGGGVVTGKQISGYFSYVQEINFFYRKPMILRINRNGQKYEMYITELVISTPIMFQFTPIVSLPLYLVAGVQLDAPISSKVTEKLDNVKETYNYNNRAPIDFGIPLGIGYLIIPNLGIDLRSVIGITSPDIEEDYSCNQYGAGLTYYF
ncbi:hypothetical protein R83H12_01543 [Fibrobacteria bacterium R8-3-H12]